MTDQEKMIRRLTLRVGIERYVTNNWRYLSQVRLNFPWASEEEFDGVFTEMVGDGLLTKTVGRTGGIKVSINGAQPAQEESNE